MDIADFIEGMTQSLQKVEESVENIELHKHASKTEQHQVMQAVLELSERIKQIEAHIRE
ncbi:hypothetical protein [Psychrobacillus sp.]|uniref:hypothetical protein n=1 Tax=Psychrobacillus sp. TaxID=1871623 RepID=UPI0028BF17E0|nr:hypothetical protein [Psychrobacillus sp.]